MAQTINKNPIYWKCVTINGNSITKIDEIAYSPPREARQLPRRGDRFKTSAFHSFPDMAELRITTHDVDTAMSLKPDEIVSFSGIMVIDEREIPLSLEGVKVESVGHATGPFQFGSAVITLAGLSSETILRKVELK